MVVTNNQVSRQVDSHADWIVSNSGASNGTNEFSRVRVDLDAVQLVVTDEDLLLLVDANVVRELKLSGTIETMEDVAVPIEDDHTHDLKNNKIIFG